MQGDERRGILHTKNAESTWYAETQGAALYENPEHADKLGNAPQSRAMPGEIESLLGSRERMNGFLPRVLLGMGAALFAGLVMLVGLYPYCPRSAGGWIIWFLAALPVWLLLEYLGKSLLGGRFFDKLSRPWRIAYGVVVVGLLYGLIILGLHFLGPHLGRWDT